MISTFSQPKKASAPIFFIPSGKNTFSRFTQPEKQSLGIVDIVSDKSIAFNS